MPWATVFDNVFLPLRLAGRPRAAVASRVMESLATSALPTSRRPIRANFPAA